MQSISKCFKKCFKQVLKVLNAKSATFPQAALGSLRFSLAQVLWVMLPVLLLLGSCGGGGGGGTPETPAPNLSISAAADASSVKHEESFSFSFTVNNSGDASADGTTLTIYRSADETLVPEEDEVEADSSSVPELAAGATSDTISTTITIPVTLAPGDYHYYACVTNTNICSQAFTITVAGIPDLGLGSAVADTDILQRGKSFTFSVTVSNVGSGRSSASATLGVYRSVDNSITPDSDTEVGTEVTVPELDAGDTIPSLSTMITAPDDLAAETYYYYACVGVAGDADRTNDCSNSVAIQVTETKPSRAIFAGHGHSCAIVERGEAWCWGDNGDGQLGNNSNADRNRPVAVVQTLADADAIPPISLTHLSGVTNMAAGGDHTCAIVSGAAKCWGQTAMDDWATTASVTDVFPCRFQG